MAFRDRQNLKAVAQQRLDAAAFDPRKLMLVYVGVSSAVMLLVTAMEAAEKVKEAEENGNDNA